MPFFGGIALSRLSLASVAGGGAGEPAAAIYGSRPGIGYYGRSQGNGMAMGRRADVRIASPLGSE